MPVFARRKLIIVEDVLAPYGITPILTLEYKGPNPQLIYHEIRKLVQLIFKAEEEELQEKELFWDRTRAEERFKINFELIKDLDIYTYLRLQIALTGFSKPSKEFGREGAATIEIRGRVHAEYPQDTIGQRLFGTFYIKWRHERKRREYIESCRTAIQQLHRELRSFLNLLPRRG
jgi:hypothetical protein